MKHRGFASSASGLSRYRHSFMQCPSWEERFGGSEHLRTSNAGLQQTCRRKRQGKRNLQTGLDWTGDWVLVVLLAPRRVRYGMAAIRTNEKLFKYEKQQFWLISNYTYTVDKMYRTGQGSDSVGVDSGINIISITGSPPSLLLPSPPRLYYD